MATPPLPGDDAVDRAVSGDQQLAAAKTAARARGLAARGGLDDAVRAQATSRIASHLEQLRASAGAGRIGVYAARGGEVEIDALAARWLAAGLVVAYPRVEGPLTLRFHHVSAVPVTPRGQFDIREPRPDDPLAQDLDLLVVPGFAFDVDGGRLGHGRGYYDRYLGGSGQRPLCVGLCFAVQLVAAVPQGAHDVRLDVVITEDGVYR